MKKTLYILFLVVVAAVITLFSCAEDRPGPRVLKASEKNLHFSGNAGAWLLTVNSNTDWQIDNTTEWCHVNKQEGMNTENITVSVDENVSGESRQTTLVIGNADTQVNIDVLQDVKTEEHHYRLPVIFHVIHDQQHEGDSVQDIKTETIHAMVRECNAAYANSVNSVDMNLELVLATEDPNGNPLQEPGIDRVLNSTIARYDADHFLKNEEKHTAGLMWNPNSYVNVYLFQCTRDDLLGVSHMALTPRENSLEGLQANNYYFSNLPKVPWGIVLNNSHIYEERAYTTLVHEMGHYLGLLHVFGENDCESTDFCEDTFNYNRADYVNSLTPEMPEMERYNRNSCEGIKFVSRNFMDYDFSYLEQFTADQRIRIRHVLENSPLIPGPKNVIVTKAVMETQKPEIRVME